LATPGPEIDGDDVRDNSRDDDNAPDGPLGVLLDDLRPQGVVADLPGYNDDDVLVTTTTCL